MLARIAQSLYWLARSVSRAEHTARTLDTLFQADVEASPEDPASVSIPWRAVPILMGANGKTGRASTRAEVIRQLTVDRDNPVSIRSCVHEAREAGRTLRDTISTEMWEALNTFYLDLEGTDAASRPAAGPYSYYGAVKSHTALFWGMTLKTMQRDDANSFLLAGGRIEAADMVLRMLRVALPPMRPADDETEELTRRDGNAHALLRAVGGSQAFMRSAASAPTAVPVAKFLLFEPDFPDSVAASAEGLLRALWRADPDPQGGPAALRLQRLIADLRLRNQSGLSYDELPGIFREVQHELLHVDGDIEDRYFAGERLTPQRQM